MSWIYVFLGGGAGSLVRYFIARGLTHYHLTFAWATLLANTLSCIVLGALLGWSMRSGLQESWRLLLMVGFCGGFSTFSTFTAETFAFLQKGDWTAAGLNMLASVLVCLGALWVGIKITS